MHFWEINRDYGDQIAQWGWRNSGNREPGNATKRQEDETRQLGDSLAETAASGDN